MSHEWNFSISANSGSKFFEECPLPGNPRRPGPLSSDAALPFPDHSISYGHRRKINQHCAEAYSRGRSYRRDLSARPGHFRSLCKDDCRPAQHMSRVDQDKNLMRLCKGFRNALVTCSISIDQAYVTWTRHTSAHRNHRSDLISRSKRCRPVEFAELSGELFGYNHSAKRGRKPSTIA
jgi:hypothetical protein